ncbi:DUF4124 domain-containing protein [Massilia consociata]|uniref:DUF4124 domain-containing protein n=1 Tax=Massilia consociata TaxID=760117 RepID=A0ABV6FHN6_9BURK
MLRFTPIPRPALLRMAGATALLLAANLAHAQYSWIGENGVRQFSDRPPPPGTPPHKILKAPGRAAQAPLAAPVSTAVSEAGPAATQAGTAPAAPPDAGGRKGPPTLAEREAAYRERVKQRAEQDRKEGLEAQRRRDLAERCELARQAKAQAESGIRVARMNADGERVFLTDEERAADAARAGRALADCR